jgi:hypothetical protein
MGPIFNLLGVVFWKILEKPVLGPLDIFCRLGKLNDFKKNLLGTLGGAAKPLCLSFRIDKIFNIHGKHV